MERKIVLTLFYMCIITTIVGILVTTVVYYVFFRKEVRENLIHECRIVAQCYDMISSPGELERFTGEEFRITLIETDGTVLFESDADASYMTNHLDRPEIQSAIENGTGSDTRYSDTLGSEDYYFAVRLDDGNILRVSIQADSIIALFERSLLIILMIIIGIIAVSMVVSVKLTDNLMAPLKHIPEMLEKNSFPDEISEYDEITSLVMEIKKSRSSQEQMRQEFTANVSHELKTPLTSISGYAEIIESGMAQGEDCVLFAGKIHSESTRLLVLIEDILKLSELDSSENLVLNDTVDLAAIVEDCRDRLQHSAQQKGINITVKGNSAPFKGNRVEIFELVYNLMDNSIKYNRENGNIEINIHETTLTVSDTGIGIPKEDIPRIFERFYRVDKSRSRARRGTGLGLSIVKHIADHHGAEIEVDSTVNVGTSITIRFK